MYRVLIAEDEILVRIGVKNLIPWEKYGMSVIADVGNGQEAWDVYEKERPELIITDIKMPVMDGMELIRRIREHNSSAAIVILTCLSDFEMARNALSLGVDEYILKLTMTPEDMERVVVKMADKLKAQAPAPSSYHPGGGAEVRWDNLRDSLASETTTIEECVLRLGGRSGDGLRLCIIEIDRYASLKTRFGDEQGHLTGMNMTGVLQHVAAAYPYISIVYAQQQQALLMIRMPGDGGIEEADAATEPFLLHLGQAVSRYFNTTVSVGLSRTGAGASPVKAQYEECRQSLDMKYVCGDGTQWRYDEHIEERLAERSEQWCKEIESSWSRLEVSIRDSMLQQLTSFRLEGKHGMREWSDFLVRALRAPIGQSRLPSEQVWQLLEETSSQIRAARTLQEAMACVTDYLDTLLHAGAEQAQYSPEVAAGIRYIQQHYRKGVTLRQLARHVNLSSNYYSMLFKRETRYSPIDYLIQYRMEIAKSLLRQSGHTISEVADQVGIHDYSYFSRIFKKITGVSPRWFRLQPERMGDCPSEYES